MPFQLRMPFQLHLKDWPRFVVVFSLAILLLTVAAAFLFVRSIGEQRDQARVVWNARLATRAEEQANALWQWTQDRFTPLRALADNASVQIYMTLLQRTDQDAAEPADMLAQRKFLADLLTVTAERGGFADRLTMPLALTNERHIGHTGIALLSPDRRLLVATNDMPPLGGALGDAIAASPKGRRSLIDFLRLPDGEVVLGFLEPIYAVQSGAAENHLVGYVVGVTNQTNGPLGLLASAREQSPGVVSTLIRIDRKMVEYIGTSSEPGRILARRLSLTTPNLASAFAATHPGGFAEKVDFLGRPVLVVSRLVNDTPWGLVVTVTTEAAFADVYARAIRNGVALLLVFAMFVAIVIAAWQRGANRRLRVLADEYRDLAQLHARQSQQLHLITTIQPDPECVIDRDGQVQFASAAFARMIGIGAEDCIGKSLDALLGPAISRPLLANALRSLETKTTIRNLEQSLAAAGDHSVGKPSRTVHISFVPMLEEPQGSVLIAFHDVTPIMAGEEQRSFRHKALVKALTALVDMRHPRLAHMSEHVAAIARGIAEELKLDPQLVEAADLSGRLMNFGALLVPRDLLARPAGLTPEESRTVRQAATSVAEAIAAADLDETIVRGLREAGESYDGSGPNGLKGDAISPIARIVAVAHAFVTAAAPRADGARPSVDAALAEIQKAAGARFDPHIVSALSNFVLNRGGAAVLEAA